ncbi:MAG: hypothetical protein GY822_03850 [Deltaproteobacteria bacterium]|nr:hypothetical protein [Deltaproteobacteria bacterium]
MSIQGGGPKSGGPKGMGAFTSVNLQNEAETQPNKSAETKGEALNTTQSDPFGGDSFSNNRTQKTEHGSFSDGFAESAEFGGKQSTTQTKGRTAMAHMMQKTLDKAQKDITSLQDEAGAVFANQFAGQLQDGSTKEALVSFMQQMQPLKKKLVKSKSRRRTLKKKKACNHLRVLPSPKKREIDEMKIELNIGASPKRDMDQLQLLTTFSNAQIKSVDVSGVQDLHQLGDELTTFAPSGLLAEKMVRLLQNDFSPAKRNASSNDQALCELILDVAS